MSIYTDHVTKSSTTDKRADFTAKNKMQLKPLFSTFLNLEQYKHGEYQTVSQNDRKYVKSSKNYKKYLTQSKPKM